MLRGRSAKDALRVRMRVTVDSDLGGHAVTTHPRVVGSSLGACLANMQAARQA